MKIGSNELALFFFIVMQEECWHHLWKKNSEHIENDHEASCCLCENNVSCDSCTSRKQFSKFEFFWWSHIVPVQGETAVRKLSTWFRSRKQQCFSQTSDYSDKVVMLFDTEQNKIFQIKTTSTFLKKSIKIHQIHSVDLHQCLNNYNLNIVLYFAPYIIMH